MIRTKGKSFMSRMRSLFEGNKLPPLVLKAQPQPFELSDADIILQLRTHLNLEESAPAIILIKEILRRAETNGTLPANLSLIGGLISSTCRQPSVSLWIISQLPPAIAELLRVRLMVDFIEGFRASDIDRCLDLSLDFMCRTPEVLHKCLTRLVLNESDELFFRIVKRLEKKGFNFNFALGDQFWLADQSGCSHGPNINPAIYFHFNGQFLHLIHVRGTHRMKEWLLGLREPKSIHSLVTALPEKTNTSKE